MYSPDAGNLVPRPRLADLLTTGPGKKFTLIAAPAGFGKTTLALTPREDPALPLARLRARDQLTFLISIFPLVITYLHRQADCLLALA